MREINGMNWQYRILHKDDTFMPVNDFESMIIGEREKEIKEDPETTKTMVLPAIKMRLNFYSNIAYISKVK